MLGAGASVQKGSGIKPLPALVRWDQPQFIHRKTHFSDFTQGSARAGRIAIVSACCLAAVTARVGLILSNG